MRTVSPTRKKLEPPEHSPQRWIPGCLKGTSNSTPERLMKRIVDAGGEIGLAARPSTRTTSAFPAVRRHSSKASKNVGLVGSDIFCCFVVFRAFTGLDFKPIKNELQNEGASPLKKTPK